MVMDKNLLSPTYKKIAAIRKGTGEEFVRII
jgi:hypothetical protein